MEKALGGKIITDYRTGAGGNLASEAVARAKPDGYAILLGTAATHGVNPALYKRLPVDVEADFALIDVKSVREFIDVVKRNPGKYNYASTGNGTATRLAFAEFNARAGLDMRGRERGRRHHRLIANRGQINISGRRESFIVLAGNVDLTPIKVCAPPAARSSASA